MTDKESNPQKPILEGLKDPDAQKWKEAWEKAQSKEEQSEAWVRERISRAPKPGR